MTDEVMINWLWIKYWYSHFTILSIYKCEYYSIIVHKYTVDMAWLADILD